ncbi:MAG: hypothetical protein GX335_03775 [Firmicutes bacterium]|nr:hypothetical protein [Bacillota bacterium]
MIITVRKALELPAMENAVLIAGEAGLDRPISSVNIMEVPDITRFVKKDELLITTTFPIKDNPEAQEKLIPSLAKKGVAALAIKPVFYDNKVPEVMIDYANQLNFPLIQLPRSTSFNELINPILGEILNRQATVLRRNDAVHRQLTDLVLQGGTLGDIAQMLASLLQTPVSIHSAQFQVLAKAAPSGSRRYAELFQDLESFSKAIQKSFGSSVGRCTALLNNRKADVHIQPVIVAGKDYARLLVWLDQNTSYETNVIEQAATVIALEIVKLQAVSETERRFRSHFIEELLKGTITDRAEILSRGRTYGWDLAQPLLPVIIGVPDYADILTAHQTEEEQLEALGRVWSALIQATSEKGIITVDIGARILLLVQADPLSSNRNLVPELLRKLKREIAIDTKMFSAGVGRILPDIMDLKTGVEQATLSLEVGRLINKPGEITHYDQLGAYRILCACSSHPEAKTFVREFLGKLIKSDQDSSTEFIATLEAFFLAKCNLRQASEQLFIHYNTLRYRLSKIEEIAQVDLDAAEDRFNLQAALKLLKLSQSRGGA